MRLMGPKPPLDQPPDRLGARGFGVGLVVNPDGDRHLQLGADAQGSHGVAARPGAAARSFFRFGY